MSRPASKLPTDGELEILRILWAKESCTLSEVREALRLQRDVATTTVATMLRVMLDKKFVKRKGAGRGCRWSAAITQEKTAGNMLGKLVDGVFDGSTRRLVAHLVETEKLSDGDLAELEQLVDAKRRKSRKGGQQ